MGFNSDIRHPFDGLNLGWLLDSHARQRGDRPFLIYEPFGGAPVRLSYRRAAMLARQVAGGLVHRGVRPGDRVIVHMDNAPEFLLTFLGCALAGAVAVTTNTQATAAELAYFIDRSGARAAVTQPRFEDVVEEAGPGLFWIAVTETDCGEPANRPGTGFKALMREGEGIVLPEIHDMDPLCVQFTSGTTARPKGAVWTHANALWAGRVGAAHQGLTPSDVHHCVMPLYHANGLSYSWLSTLWAGGTLLLQPRFSASRFWDVAVRNCATLSSLTPYYYKALRAHPRPDVHCFRHWGVAHSNPLVSEGFGIPPIGWYGMTETVTQVLVGVPQIDTPHGAIGRVAPEYRIRILSEDGRAVRVGETGALSIKGQPGLSLFKEYLGDAAATRAAYDDDGWFDTGDRITVLENGFLKFADRAKDILKSGYETVSPSEVEAVIRAIPGVLECAVVGRPDAMRGEVPVAFVRVSRSLAGMTQSALLRYVTVACSEQLAGFKVPHDVIVVDEFPRANVGKIAKAELRAGLKMPSQAA
ncbi:class I adenylate-forming enzyme family protein [Chachezhania sediminis]|uniref:class I adenylate-forming enzyme family protein n=1 Tax=Chachezhania sediminis TaxID=2599291 RepID=UPI00131D06C7|nr:AMP-binding protein [Chachezhania sediminis]